MIYNTFDTTYMVYDMGAHKRKNNTTARGPVLEYLIYIMHDVCVYSDMYTVYSAAVTSSCDIVIY